MDIDDKELVQLIRVGLAGKAEELAAIARRLARRMREKSPDVAEAITKLAKAGHGQITRGSAIASLPVDLESRLELAKVEHDVHLSIDPIWTPAIEDGLNQIISERKNVEALAQEGLHPSRSLLFVGPPGVGKTLTARWIAAELRIPLITLDLAAVMSSFLGRTGNNLRNILDYAKGINCVLLLDEFDAIAKRRDDAIEVGELKRLVTVLLQEIDRWPVSGMLIAATNHPELLDPAIWRRFDSVLTFEIPDAPSVEAFVISLLGADKEILARAIAPLMNGLSFSDIEREILRAKRQVVLTNYDLSESLESFIEKRCAGRKPKDRLAIAMNLVSLGYSDSKASGLTGVSRDTMRKERLSTKQEDHDG